MCVSSSAPYGAALLPTEVVGLLPTTRAGGRPSGDGPPAPPAPSAPEACASRCSAGDARELAPTRACSRMLLESAEANTGRCSNRHASSPGLTAGLRLRQGYGGTSRQSGGTSNGPIHTEVCQGDRLVPRAVARGRTECGGHNGSEPASWRRPTAPASRGAPTDWKVARRRPAPSSRVTAASLRGTRPNALAVVGPCELALLRQRPATPTLPARRPDHPHESAVAPRITVSRSAVRPLAPCPHPSHAGCR
jgi:hypothetical protein